MISYWSSRHGHTCPAINCFKGHLRHFHYLIGIVVLFLSGCCMSCILLLAYVSIHFQSLQSIITDDEKHYQCQNIVLNNKPRSLFLEFNWWINNCLHRWERYSWECWQRHDMTRDNSTFRECSPLRARSSFKRLLYCGSKVLGVVQSTKCFVLKWETSVGFPLALSEVFFCTSIQILSIFSFASLNATFFAYFKSLIKISKGFKKWNCRNCFRKTGLNTTFSFLLKESLHS